MPNKSINKISSPGASTIKKFSWISLCLLLLSAFSFVQSAYAQSAPGTTYPVVSSIVKNYEAANKGYKPNATMPTVDPGGAAGGQGDVSTQAMPQPPGTIPNAQQTVPPMMVPYFQEQVPMAINPSTSSQASDDMTPNIKGASGLPATAGEISDAIAAVYANQIKEDFAPGRLIPAAQVVAQTLFTSGANSIGTALQGPAGTGGMNGSLAQGFGGMGVSMGGGGAGGGMSGDGGELDSFLGSIAAFPPMGLINVANEAAGIPTVSFIPFKTIPQAVWMVQQMYKHFSIPLALLLLLPGAVITQVKAQVTASFNLKGEDATSPFEGILRSVIAIFLIPATQLIVSYSIDVGNSLAFSVNPAVGIMPILGWVQQVAYTTMPSNTQNAILPPRDGGPSEVESSGSDGGGPGSPFLGGGPLSGILGGGGLGAGGMGGGLAAGESDDMSVPENQSNLSTTLETMFNVMMYMFSIGILVMTAFQLVIMCYLYLLGPVAAAFFAWPSVRGKLFRTVFGNWTNAVITVSLWRFYWMVILAIMTNRLLNLGENGSMLFNLQWEVAIFTCLIGLLFYAPMRPWDFDPGQAYRSVKFFGESIMQAGASAGGGGGGGAPSGGTNSSSSGADSSKGGGANKGGGNETNKGGGTESNTNKGGDSNKTTLNASTPPGTENSKTSNFVAETSSSPASQSQGAPSGNEPAKGEAPPMGSQPQLALNDQPTNSPNTGSSDRGQSNPNTNANSGQNPPPANQGAMAAGQMLTTGITNSGGQSFNSGNNTNTQTGNSTSSSGQNGMPLPLNPASSEQGSAGNNASPSVTPNPNATPEDVNKGMQDYQPAKTAMNETNMPPASTDNSAPAPESPPPPPPSPNNNNEPRLG